MRARSRRRPGANDRRPNDHTRRTLGQGHPSRIAHVPPARAVQCHPCPVRFFWPLATTRSGHSTPHRRLRAHSTTPRKQRQASKRERAPADLERSDDKVRTCADTIRMAPSHLTGNGESREHWQAGCVPLSWTIENDRRSGAGRGDTTTQAPIGGRRLVTSAGLSLAGGRVLMANQPYVQCTPPFARPLMPNCLPEIMRFHCTSAHVLHTCDDNAVLCSSSARQDRTAWYVGAPRQQALS